MKIQMDAEQLAKFFHKTYEELAPSFGYATREASRKTWESVPEKNRALMIAVCQQVIFRLDEAVDEVVSESTAIMSATGV